MKQRNINLKLLLGEPLSIDEKNYIMSIIFLKEKTQGLNSYTSTINPDYIFYGKTKEDIIFQYNKKNKGVWVNHDEVWLVFKNQFKIENDDIKNIIQKDVVNTLQIEVININSRRNFPTIGV